MKRIILTAVTFFIVSLAMPAGAADDWRALTEEAYAQADLVVRGTVQSVDDQTEVDGGHVYSLQVSSLDKGLAEDSILVRAGGFFYTVRVNVGESLLVFLKTTKGGHSASKAPVYSLVEVATLKPMVFLASGNEVKPVDKRLQPEFANVDLADFENLLSAINPKK